MNEHTIFTFPIAPFELGKQAIKMYTDHNLISGILI